jgi:hypothetical protein
MKKVFIAISVALITFRCTNKKAESKAAFDDLIKVHDKVMGADEQLMNNKMQLDTLLKQDKFTEKDTAKLLITKLVSADSAMATWMHNFEPDHKGKSDDETLSYMNGQKKQIIAIDSQINAAVAESNKYLHKIKGK